MEPKTEAKSGPRTAFFQFRRTSDFEQQSNENARRRGNALAEDLKREDAIRWGYSLGVNRRFEILSLAVCPTDVVAVLQHQERDRAQTEWSVAAFDSEKGELRYQHRFTNEPLPGGLLIDSQGNIVVMMHQNMIGF